MSTDDGRNKNKLVYYRKRMGYTQRQTARLLGYRSASMLSHYEHGPELPPLAVALKLEIILRTPVAFLFPNLYDRFRNDIRQLEERSHHSTCTASTFHCIPDAPNPR